MNTNIYLDYNKLQAYDSLIKSYLDALRVGDVSQLLDITQSQTLCQYLNQKFTQQTSNTDNLKKDLYKQDSADKSIREIANEECDNHLIQYDNNLIQQLKTQLNITSSVNSLSDIFNFILDQAIANNQISSSDLDSIYNAIGYNKNNDNEYIRPINHQSSIYTELDNLLNQLNILTDNDTDVSIRSIAISEANKIKREILYSTDSTSLNNLYQQIIQLKEDTNKDLSAASLQAQITTLKNSLMQQDSNLQNQITLLANNTGTDGSISLQQQINVLKTDTAKEGNSSLQEQINGLRAATIQTGNNSLQEQINNTNMLISSLSQELNTLSLAEMNQAVRNCQRVGDVSLLFGINNNEDETFVSWANSQNAKLTTLIGADTNCSVRDIAISEITNELSDPNRSVDFDTLKEIADWIQDHPRDAAAMNTAIIQVGKTIGLIPTFNNSQEVLPLTGVRSDSIYEALDQLSLHIGWNSADTAHNSLYSYIQSIESSLLLKADLSLVNNLIASDSGKSIRAIANEIISAKIGNLPAGKSTVMSYIGLLPSTVSSPITTIVDYIQSQSSTLQNNINSATTRLTTIENDYLKAVDKTQLNNSISLKLDASKLGNISTTIKEYVDTNILNLSNTLSTKADASALNTLTSEVTQTKSKLNTLIGSDSNKSVSTIADNLINMAATSFIQNVIGSFPDDTTIKQYIDTSVSTISGDSAVSLGNVVSRVQAIESDYITSSTTSPLANRLTTIENDYLKAADKTSLQNSISSVNTKLTAIIGNDTNKTIREIAALELAGTKTDVTTIKNDYLKAADKTSLQNSINSVNAKLTTIIGNDTNKTIREIAASELAGTKTDVTNIKNDYLKAADKTELQTNINNLRVGSVSQLTGIQGNETFVGYINRNVAAYQTITNKVNTLIDTGDTNKSIRTIIREELQAMTTAEIQSLLS